MGPQDLGPSDRLALPPALAPARNRNRNRNRNLIALELLAVPKPIGALSRARLRPFSVAAANWPLQGVRISVKARSALPTLRRFQVPLLCCALFARCNIQMISSKNAFLLGYANKVGGVCRNDQAPRFNNARGDAFATSSTRS